jgi:hypothetical protein
VVVDAGRVLQLDVRLEPREVGLNGPLHEPEAGGHLLHHPGRLELHLDHHAGEPVAEPVEADDPTV